MNNPIPTAEQKTNKRSFNIYVDLYDKGEFNEILVIPDKRKFSVIYDDFKLGTITKDVSNSWIKVDGSMPREKLEQIGNMINLRLHR